MTQYQIFSAEEWKYIPIYEPRFTDSAELLALLLADLAIPNIRVDSVWSLWDLEDDFWWDTAPIVFCTSVGQLEFCATHVNRFSFSLNSIDLAQPVYDSEDIDPGDKPMLWIQNKNPELANLAGQKLERIEVVEFSPHVDGPVQEALQLANWIVAGIALTFTSGYVAIVNGLDCNTLSCNRYEGKEIRYQPVDNDLGESRDEQMSVDCRF